MSEAVVSGASALIVVSAWAGHPVVTWARPCRHASRICRAARSPCIAVSGVAVSRLNNPASFACCPRTSTLHRRSARLELLLDTLKLVCCA